MTLMDGAERRTSLDGLQLPGIADQHDLCASFCSMRQHPLQLERTDHAGLVEDKDMARREQVAALAPAMFKAGDGAGRDARSGFEILGRNAGQRRAPDLITGRFPCFPRHAQHRAFASSGMADHDA